MIATLLTAFAIVAAMKFFQQVMLNWMMPDLDPELEKHQPESLS